MPEKHDLPPVSLGRRRSPTYPHSSGGGGAGLTEAPRSERLTLPELAHSRRVQARVHEDEPTTSSWEMALARLCLRRPPRLVRRRVGTENMAFLSRKLGLNIPATAVYPVGVAWACRMGRIHCFPTLNASDRNPLHKHTDLDVY